MKSSPPSGVGPWGAGRRIESPATALCSLDYLTDIDRNLEDSPQSSHCDQRRTDAVQGLHRSMRMQKHGETRIGKAERIPSPRVSEKTLTQGRTSPKPLLDNDAAYPKTAYL